MSTGSCKKLISSTTTSHYSALPSSSILKTDLASTYLLPDSNVFIYPFIIHEPSWVAKIFATCFAIAILWSVLLQPLLLVASVIYEIRLIRLSELALLIWLRAVYLMFPGDSWCICHSLSETRKYASVTHSSTINFRVNLLSSMHSHEGLSFSSCLSVPKNIVFSTWPVK